MNIFDLSNLVPSTQAADAAEHDDSCITTITLVPAQDGLVAAPTTRRRKNLIDGKPVNEAEAWLDGATLKIYVRAEDGTEYKLSAIAPTATHQNLTHMVSEGTECEGPLYVYNNKDRKVPHVFVTSKAPRNAELANKTVNKRF